MREAHHTVLPLSLLGPRLEDHIGAALDAGFDVGRPSETFCERVASFHLVCQPPGNQNLEQLPHAGTIALDVKSDHDGAVIEPLRPGADAHDPIRLGPTQIAPSGTDLWEMAIPLGVLGIRRSERFVPQPAHTGGLST